MNNSIRVKIGRACLSCLDGDVGVSSELLDELDDDLIAIVEGVCPHILKIDEGEYE